jgi:mRNA-degrading endonuclease toxin of MazEF toxin-antitoxin module
MNRGEIYYVSKTSIDDPGSYVIQPGRPAIVVSDTTLNNTQNIVSVVFLTSKPKMISPAHFITRCNGVTGTALCEEVVTIDKARLGKYVGKLSDHEIEQLNNCLRAVFCLGDNVPYASNEDLAKAQKECEHLRKQIEAYRTLLFSQEVI